MPYELYEKVKEEIVRVIQQKDHELFVCVPVESLSLRESAGFGEDIVAELLPGTYVKWYGDKEEVSDVEFYKVEVEEAKVAPKVQF